MASVRNTGTLSMAAARLLKRPKNPFPIYGRSQCDRGKILLIDKGDGDAHQAYHYHPDTGYGG